VSQIAKVRSGLGLIRRIRVSLSSRRFGAAAGVPSIRGLGI
jgi:hypothetical protein